MGFREGERGKGGIFQKMPIARFGTIKYNDEYATTKDLKKQFLHKIKIGLFLRIKS